METAPLFAVIGGAMVLAWMMRRAGESERLMGLGIGLGAGLLAGSILFRSWQWAYPACDGFTVTLFRGGMLAALAPMGIALVARERMGGVTRAIVAIAIGGVVAAAIGRVAPACLAPYGNVDPMLVRLWLGQVGEAQPLFAAAPATAIGYAGVMVAGLIATAWQCRVTRDRRWVSLLLVLTGAVALTCWQLRGAYVGAILAAPGLAAVIAAARARGAAWLVLAYAGSAGMLYPIAAAAVTRPVAAGAAEPGGSCTDRRAVATLAALPPGRVIAPLDLGAYAIGATRLDPVAAPYHRNNAGNLAAYRFFLGAAPLGAAIARDWRVDYVVACAGRFGALPAEAFRRDALDARLHRGERPNWLVPVARAPNMTVYRVERGLLDVTRPR